MRIPVLGGSGPAFINDIKVYVRLKRADTARSLQTIFPGLFREENGQLVVEPRLDPARADSFVESVEVESTKLTFLIFGALTVVGVLLFFVFRKR